MSVGLLSQLYSYVNLYSYSEVFVIKGSLSIHRIEPCTLLIHLLVQVNNLEQEVFNLKRCKASFQSLQLPKEIPPTSSDVITSLNEHLLLVLKTLQQREKQLEVAQEALEKFQMKFSVIIHQQVSAICYNREIHWNSIFENTSTNCLGG